MERAYLPLSVGSQLALKSARAFVRWRAAGKTTLLTLRTIEENNIGGVMKYDTLDDGRERLDDYAQTEEAMLMRDVFTNVAAPLCSYWDGEHCWSLLAEPAHECACGLEENNIGGVMICKYCEKVEERCECDKYTNSLLDQIADLKHQLAEAHAAIKDIAEIVGDPACIRDGHIQRICEEVLREAGKK